MVPELIWAPDFFGLQEIWAPRSLGPKKFGPEEISQVSNANPLYCIKTFASLCSPNASRSVYVPHRLI